ncbi:MAG: hypothetical protein NUW08_00995 [Candidatus Uhrbacteria bacterium]|nr:hypothetical protein [Candidatus Uhrbacteria bacterium]
MRNLAMIAFMFLFSGCYAAHGIGDDSVSVTSEFLIEFDSAEPVAMIAIEHWLELAPMAPYRVEPGCYEEVDGVTGHACVIDVLEGESLAFNVAVYDPTARPEDVSLVCHRDPDIEAFHGFVTVTRDGEPVELERLPAAHADCYYVVR